MKHIEEFKEDILYELRRFSGNELRRKGHRENFVIELNRYLDDVSEEYIVQTVGAYNFNLIEVVMKKDKTPFPGEFLYIGDGNRDDVDYIKRRITFDQLTKKAKRKLDYVLESLIKFYEDRFLEFINKAPARPLVANQPHTLAEIPLIGKLRTGGILSKRKMMEIDSFNEIEGASDLNEKYIITLLKKRIKKEMKGNLKRYYFVFPPKGEDKDKYYNW